MKPKRAVVGVLAIAGAVAGLALLDAFFYLRPIVAESCWRAALATPIEPLQYEAIRALRKHPTGDAALALVEFINAKSRTGDLEPAVRAAETLCALSGRSFGGWFANCSAGRDWARHAEQWPDMLERINAWAGAALRQAP